MLSFCPFCQIVQKQKPAQVVYEDNEILAFRDIHPAAPIHILIIPKKHIKCLADAQEKDVEVLGRIQTTSGKIAKKLGIGNGFRLLIASGAWAGQTVFHIHYHLLGGWKNKPTWMEA